eukprot:snap_masked-scaffold_2-processed-gene-23.44-mRNA-1 protein AED:1.00 eAED:1.00 QI:0/0/0/0/1/1/2/0/73
MGLIQGRERGSREVYRQSFGWFLGQDVDSGCLGVLAVLGWDGVREIHSGCILREKGAVFHLLAGVVIFFRCSC